MYNFEALVIACLATIMLGQIQYVWRARQDMKALKDELQAIQRALGVYYKAGDATRRYVERVVCDIAQSKHHVTMPLSLVLRAIENTDGGRVAAMHPAAPVRKQSQEERWLAGEVPTFIEPSVELLVDKARREIDEGMESYNG